MEFCQILKVLSLSPPCASASLFNQGENMLSRISLNPKTPTNVELIVPLCKRGIRGGKTSSLSNH